MYFLFCEKNIMPSRYWNMGEGEKVVVRAFFEKTMEERSRER